MSKATPKTHALPDGWTAIPHYNDSYTAGEWKGYGYVGIVAVAPGEEFNGTFRNIAGRQVVVAHIGKLYMGDMGSSEGAKAYEEMCASCIEMQHSAKMCPQ